MWKKAEIKKMNKKIYEWVATSLSILGAILNAFLIKEGFIFWGLQISFGLSLD